ncbi:MAG: hypothetical protein ACFFA6_10915 [Promethearchaeota archaeon]
MGEFDRIFGLNIIIVAFLLVLYVLLDSFKNTSKAREKGLQ